MLDDAAQLHRWRIAFLENHLQCGEFALNEAAVNHDQQVGLALEVMVDGALCGIGLVGDVLQTSGLVSLPSKEHHCSFDNPLPGFEAAAQSHFPNAPSLPVTG